MKPAPTRQLAAWCLGLAVALLAGCRAAPPVAYYSLSPLAAAEVYPSENAGPLVGVGPVTVPDMLDRPQIVTRTSANRIDVSEFHRWGGRLKDALPRVLIQNIAVHLGSDRVALYPWKEPTRPAYRVSVDILRFDGRLGEAVDLVAAWKISRPADDDVPVVRRSSFRAAVDGPGYDALVTAQGRALDDLAKTIAEAIKTLEK